MVVDHGVVLRSERRGIPGALSPSTRALRIPGPHQRFPEVMLTVIEGRRRDTELCPVSTAVNGWSPKRTGRSAGASVVRHGEAIELQPATAADRTSKGRLALCITSGTRVTVSLRQPTVTPLRSRALSPRPLQSAPSLSGAGSCD